MAIPSTVKELMTSSVTSLEPGARLLDAVLLMRSSGFRHIPVAVDGKLVGIISDRDVKRFSPSLLGDVSQEEYNRIFEETSIEKVMSKEPIAVQPESPVMAVIELMHDRKFGAVPVVDAEKNLVGIVTTTDALGLLKNLLEGGA